MARPYSDDLRRKLLESHDPGKGTLAGLADQFGVSLSWAWKISSARKRTGSTERKRYQPGPKVRVDRDAVWRLLEDQPDLYEMLSYRGDLIRFVTRLARHSKMEASQFKEPPSLRRRRRWASMDHGLGPDSTRVTMQAI
jgi:transposase